jgi:hypothetical protein
MEEAIMAAETTVEEILRKLLDVAKSSTKQQNEIAERYTNLYERLLKGELERPDLAKWNEFWIDEARILALAVTDISLIYYKVMLGLNDEFSKRLEKIAKGAPVPAPPEAARPAAAARRGAAAKRRSRPRAKSARPAQ